ncbi:hypothetical protein NDU88_005725, partial [Pleurodeles waltl]
REAEGEYILEYCESGEAVVLLRLSKHLGDKLMGETCPDDAALDRNEPLLMETTGDVGVLLSAGGSRCSASCKTGKTCVDVNSCNDIEGSAVRCFGLDVECLDGDRRSLDCDL